MLKVFILLLVSFSVQKLSGFDEVPLVYLLLLLLPLVTNPKKFLPRPLSSILLLMFSSKSFTVSDLESVFNSFWVYFCTWYNISAPFHSFACVFFFQFSRQRLLRRPFSLHCVFFAPCHKIIDFICTGLFGGSWFSSIDLCVCFYVLITKGILFDCYFFYNVSRVEASIRYSLTLGPNSYLWKFNSTCISLQEIELAHYSEFFFFLVNVWHSGSVSQKWNYDQPCPRPKSFSGSLAKARFL